MSSEQRKLGAQRDHDLDVLWVSTVPDEALYPQIRDPEGRRDPFISRAFDPDDERPIHGTMTVDVCDHGDRKLLRRLLTTNRVLAVTAADGWTQRVRLTAVRKIETEEAADGSHLVVATYSWIAAASFN